MNGRRRQTPISLADCAGSYGADANGRLIVKPQGAINSGAFDKKDAGEESPWRLSGVTEQEIVQQITAPLSAFFEALEPVRPRKATLAVQADPLGLKTGAYARRARTFPTKPTPERVARAKEMGECLDDRPVVSDKGVKLSETITEITPVLRILKSRGTIDPEEYAAALQLCQDWHGARFRGAATVRYRERVDGEGGGQNYESDHVISCRQRVYHALRAVDPVLSPAVAWVISTMGDSPPLSKIGEYYAPDKPLNTQSTRGADALRFALMILCRHYGFNHRLAKLSQTAQNIVAMIA